jgi:hypothetical protein
LGIIAKVFDDLDNTARSRSIPCIALYPCCNAARSWHFLNLVTKKRVRCLIWKRMVTTDLFMQKMNAFVEEGELDHADMVE